VCPKLIELNKAIDRAQQMRLRHMPFERKLVEQRILLDLSLPHHRLPLSRRDLRKSGDYNTAAPTFFNAIAHELTFDAAK